MNQQQRVLVLGASGGIGGETARQLRDAGWEVRALRRGLTQALEHRDGITWLRGDAMRAPDVAHAAAGCAVIVHAVNPPGYRHWAQTVLPMLENTIAAAIAAAATIVLPGTVYNYSPDAGPIGEDTPQHPVSRKGAIRVAMEQRLREASTQGARVVIVRAGDFFGPHPGSSWFSQGLIKPGKAVRSISYPGRPGVGHQWAYLPDVASTMLALLARRATLAPFATFHMDGHWDADGTQMCAAIARVVSRETGRAPRVASFPWWMLPLAAPFVATLHEMQEMRYLWRTPLRMDNARLVATLGQEPHTPLDQAVRASLAGLRCIPDASGAGLTRAPENSA